MEKKLILIVAVAFLMISGFGSRTVFALTETANGCVSHRVSMSLMSPVPGETFRLGDKVTFTGRIWQPGTFVNAGFCPRIIFYVSADEDIPVTDCCGRPQNLCCIQPGGSCLCQSKAESLCAGLAKKGYGALPVKQCSALGDLPFRNEVKYLDPGEAKLVKLGETSGYGRRAAGNGGNFEIFFNQTLTMPDDAGLQGPVRFYIQYTGIGSGTDRTAAWQWYVAYQKGTILFAGAEDPVNPGASSKVKVLTSPVVQPDYCTSSSGPIALLSWKLSDKSFKQQSYQVQIFKAGDLDQPIIESGRVNSAVPGYGTVSGKMSYGESYSWRVRAWLGDGSYTAWAGGPSIIMPKHPYPAVKFSWNPKKISTADTVSFSDQSEIYGSQAWIKWKWTFEGGSLGQSNVQNPKLNFPERGVKNISLRVTDSDGYSCSYSRMLEVKGSPDFED